MTDSGRHDRCHGHVVGRHDKRQPADLIGVEVQQHSLGEFIVDHVIVDGQINHKAYDSAHVPHLMTLPSNDGSGT